MDQMVRGALRQRDVFRPTASRRQLDLDPVQGRARAHGVRIVGRAHAAGLGARVTGVMEDTSCTKGEVRGEAGGPKLACSGCQVRAPGHCEGAGSAQRARNERLGRSPRAKRPKVSTGEGGQARASKGLGGRAEGEQGEASRGRNEEQERVGKGRGSR